MLVSQIFVAVVTISCKHRLWLIAHKNKKSHPFVKGRDNSRVTTFFYNLLAQITLVSTDSMLYSPAITGRSCHSLLRKQFSLFGVQLQEVFEISFPCTSHQPVTFCQFHLSYLFFSLLLFASIITYFKIFSIIFSN